MTRPSESSNKKIVLANLYDICKARGNFVFSNNEVRAVSADFGFGNQFDATKLDDSSDLPNALIADDVFVVHLGRHGNETAKHQFVHNIAIGFHEFEPIPDSSKIEWRYRPSILNNINTSESNFLSIANNQRILHDFLYEDIAASPKVYNSNRTQLRLDYRVGENQIQTGRVQMEIDMTMEYLGMITALEAKNGYPPDFNVFQLFNPFRYYLQATQDREDTSINCCYLLRLEDRMRLYLYRFTNPQNPGSITLIRNAEYRLVER